MATAHLLGNLLPFSAVQLGRLVLNAKSPQDDYIDPLDGLPADGDFDRNIQTDYKETRRFSTTSKLRPYLNALVTFSFEKQNVGTATLSAPLAVMYNLKNSGLWFRDACKQPGTRKFLENAFNEGQNAYLVVGFRTLQDASLVKGVTWKKVQGVGSDVPLHLVTGGMATSSLAAAIAAPGVELVRGVGNGQELSFKAPGEQIIAVLYRKVRCKLLSGRTIDKMSLEVGNRWVSEWNWRGPEEEFDGEEDMLEAELADESDLDITDEEYDSEKEEL